MEERGLDTGRNDEDRPKDTGRGQARSDPLRWNQRDRCLRGQGTGSRLPRCSAQRLRMNGVDERLTMLGGAASRPATERSGRVNVDEINAPEQALCLAQLREDELVVPAGKRQRRHWVEGAVMDVERVRLWRQYNHLVAICGQLGAQRHNMAGGRRPDRHVRISDERNSQNPSYS